MENHVLKESSFLLLVHGMISHMIHTFAIFLWGSVEGRMVVIVVVICASTKYKVEQNVHL